MNMSVDTRLEFPNLIELFHQALAEPHVPETTCLEIIASQRSESITFAQLRTRALNLAQYLIAEADLKPYAKVAILGKNRIEWDIAFWAAVFAGAVPVLIDPERPPQAVFSHVTHTDTALIVMADDYRDTESRTQLLDLAKTNNVQLLQMDGDLGRNPPAGTADLTEISPSLTSDDTAVILCTSGTTGDPREVELTHRNLIANVQGTLKAINITHADILGHIIPAHHSFGLTVAKLLTLRVGATNIYTNKYRRISQIIKDKNITIFAAIPSLYTVLAKKLEDALAEQKKQSRLLALIDRFAPKLVAKQIRKKQGWEKLRFFVSGAAPVPQWVLDVFWKRDFKLYQGYGTTENSPAYGFNENPQKLASVGPPISTIAVKILDENGQPLPPGQRGEINLGGPCIMKGYFKNPESTNAVRYTDDSGAPWLRTGDLGHLDDDGYLYITGRKKFMIVLPSGKNVAPELVEAALSEARFIAEILILPGSRKNSAGLPEETIRAIIHPDFEQLSAHTGTPQADLEKDPQNLKDILWKSINLCQQNSTRLSPFERVASKKDIEVVIEGFQKTSTGKIKRQLYLST